MTATENKTSGTRMPAALPDYLPARMLNEYAYCPRLFYYEWVDGVFAESGDTVEGSLRHERVDKHQDPLPPPDAEPALSEGVASRSVSLSSETFKLIAKIDLVESESGAVTPVDYKKGRPRDDKEGPQAWPSDRIQIGVQALVLRENGYRCDEGVLYYHETRQRVRIAIDDELVRETLEMLDAARGAAAAGSIPAPLVDSPKCPRCSLVAICLPDETRVLELDDSLASDPQMSLFDEPPLIARGDARPVDDAEIRRLVPARDDLRPLYVAGHGVSIGKSGDVLQVRGRDRMLQEVRFGETSQINLFGAVQISAQAIQALCQADKPIAHFSHGGWFYGLTQGLGLRNVFLRRAQFANAEIPYFGVHVARSLVTSKILNQRTLLLRNHAELAPSTASRLKQAAAAAAAADSLEVLLGIEGTAARLYFESFAGMIKVEPDDAVGATGFRFDFENRNRRPPRDPVNAMLSFAYSMLAKDLTIICAAVGFDPFMGFYHRPRFGRPALALDLMEEFRPLIADSAVLTAINTRMLRPHQFVAVGQAVAMKPAARKSLIQAYEQRMDALVTHPRFGYRVNYRRVLEIQARLLARVVTGELHRYSGFETR